jgi:hypothetical protein
MTECTPKMASFSNVKHPIFIVGCGRSGTTLLFDLMSQHPRLARTMGYPDGEDHEGWIKHGKCVMAGIGNVHHGAYGSGINGHHYCLHMTADDVTDVVAGAMREHYWENVLQRDPSRRVINKQPHLSNKLDYVLGIFPDAKIVHIVRDCEPMVASWLAIMAEHPNLVVYWPGDEPFPCLWLMPKPSDEIARKRLAKHPRFYPGGGAELWIDYWCEVNTGIARQMEGKIPQLLTLRYEDLIERPTTILDKLTQFCGLDAFDFDVRHLDSTTAGKHTHLMGSELQAAISDRAGATRALFGYQPGAKSLMPALCQP